MPEIIALATAKVKSQGSTNAAAKPIDSPVMATFNGRVISKNANRVCINANGLSKNQLAKGRNYFAFVINPA
jgi:hypothetical protein